MFTLLIRLTLYQTASTNLLIYPKHKTGRAALSVSGNPNFYFKKSHKIIQAYIDGHRIKLVKNLELG